MSCTKSNYIPFLAEGTIEINHEEVTLDLIGYTEYGLVTVDIFHITSAKIEDSQIGTIEMATSQDNYYKYVKQGQEPLVQITEDILNTEPSYQLPSINALVRYNLFLNMNELNVISFILSDFEQENIFFEIDQNAARTYVPDDNFEQALIDLGYDDVLDDYVLTSNISNIYNIDLSDRGIEDAAGIENFITLSELYIHRNNLTNIDLSQNTNLFILWLFDNELESLDISDNLNLNYLFAELNNITEIDVSKNLNLVHIAISANPLASIDVSSNNKLVRLDITNTLLQELDVTQNPELIHLTFNNVNSIEYQNTISSIDLTNNPELILLNSSHINLTSIDLSNNSKLEKLMISDSGLTALDVSNMNNLNLLETFLNDITCIQVNQNQLNDIPSTWQKDTNTNYSLDCSGTQIPLSGLVAWYPFNGNANDESGNNLNANVIGATLTNDRNNAASKAYDFDYANASFGLQNDEIFVPYSSLMNVNNITVSVWLNPHSYFWSGNADPNSTIINRFQYTYSNPSGGSWGITFNQTSVTGFILGSDGTSGSSVVSNNALVLNQWHHLVMTYNGTQIKLRPLRNTTLH